MLRRIVAVIVPWVLASTVGILVLVGFFVSMPSLDSWIDALLQWATIIVAFGFVLGLVNVARVHGKRIVRREHGWPYSIVLLLSALTVLLLGLRPGSYGPGDALVQWVFRYVLEPLALTFFSLLAFFLVSAIFRTLRLRNLEAILAIIVAVIVLIGQMPISPPWAFWQDLVQLQEWLLRVPAMAGVRAILIGAAVGAVATAMRVILGLERPYAE